MLSFDPHGSDRSLTAATIFRSNQSLERYFEHLESFYGQPLSPDVIIKPIDAFLMQQMLTYYPIAQTIIDVAADATLGASTVLWAGHPKARHVIAARATGEKDAADGWRRLFPTITDGLDLIAGSCTLSNADLDEAGDWKERMQAVSPWSSTIMISAALTQGSLDEMVSGIRRLASLHTDVIIFLFPLGLIGGGVSLEAALAFCRANPSYRLTALRELTPFFSASQLGIIYKNDNTNVSEVLRRVEQLYHGNFQFLPLVQSYLNEAMTAAALRQELEVVGPRKAQHPVPLEVRISHHRNNLRQQGVRYIPRLGRRVIRKLMRVN